MNKSYLQAEEFQQWTPTRTPATYPSWSSRNVTVDIIDRSLDMKDAHKNI